MPKYTFVRQTERIKEIIRGTYDPLKEWQADPKGYFLVRINPKRNVIEAGFATNKHIIIKKIYGQSASEVYMTIIRKKLISRLEHAAYLGKELYKAELALKYGKRYRQEFPLQFSELKVAVKLKRES